MLRASAAERNAVPLTNVLAKYLLEDMKLLEISSGTGQHIIEFATKFPYVTFQPSEVDARCLHSIVAYIDHNRLANVRVPLYIDVTKPVNHWALPTDYGPLAVDVILNINMIHISSNAAIEGLFRASIWYSIKTWFWTSYHIWTICNRWSYYTSIKHRFPRQST
uniref:UPF0744 protein n=1 Tax=Haemonchus contortus TaxID=6289 RepID=A0A7I4Y579_HAECO